MNTGNVGGIDDGGDVEVGDVVPTLESNLAQHALSVAGVRTLGEPVTNPSSRESDGLGVSTGNLDRADLGVTSAGSEDDLTAGAVLADESNSVGGANNRAGGSNESGDLGEELHLD